MIGDEERREEITFNAVKKPETVKVFEFTKDMLPERDLERFEPKITENGWGVIIDEYIEVSEFKPKIIFFICKDKINGFIDQSNHPEVKVGDYLIKKRWGYSVITREEFKREWVRK